MEVKKSPKADLGKQKKYFLAVRIGCCIGNYACCF